MHDASIDVRGNLDREQLLPKLIAYAVRKGSCRWKHQQGDNGVSETIGLLGQAQAEKVVGENTNNGGFNSQFQVVNTCCCFKQQKHLNSIHIMGKKPELVDARFVKPGRTVPVV